MNIDVGPTGRVNLGAPQQRWSEGNGGDPALLQVARFAGQEMMAVTDDEGGFQLFYLGFEATGFPSMDAAKAAAPAFARQVLGRLATLIAD